MIATNFAPNENWDDAWAAIKLLLQPWRWKSGTEINEIKKKIGLQVSLFMSGRFALFHLLASFQLKPNSEVLVQAFTCEAVILPILANKLKPVYVDIESQTFSMNPIDLEKKLTKKAKVLILQHTFGMTPVNRNKILNLVRRHNLLLIEDIAHGAQFSISNFQFSKSYLLLSFGRNKTISSVFGGAIVTKDKKIGNELKEKESRRRDLDYFTLMRLILYKPLAMLIKSTYDLGIGRVIHRFTFFINFIIPEITEREKRGAYDSILDKAYPNALAILLLHQFKKFERIQRNRARICALYCKNFKLRITDYAFPLIRFPLLLPNRDEVISKMKRHNIILGKWYEKVVAPKELDLKKMLYKGGCPEAEKISEKIINLPTTISYSEAQTIIKLLKTIRL